MARLACLAAIFAATACGPAVLRWITPSASASLTWMPVDLALDFAATAAASTLSVTLNGNDVTPLFAIEPAQGGRVVARASDVWGGWVAPGANLLEASVQVGAATYRASRSFTTSGDAFGDAVVSYVQGTDGGFGAGALPGVVTGPPSGAGLFQGGLDVVSLGFGGSIVVEFTDNAIADGEGPDLIVFENAFLAIAFGSGLTSYAFADPGRVSVSQDGIAWSVFDCALVPDPTHRYPGCAGVYPVLADADDPAAPHGTLLTTTPLEALLGVPWTTLSPPAGAGGDSFDLADVGLSWARFVRVDAATFADAPTGGTNAGFDLDAVAAVNSVPATDANGNGVPDAVE
jgi:hypothetical protein